MTDSNAKAIKKSPYHIDYYSIQLAGIGKLRTKNNCNRLKFLNEKEFLLKQ